MTEQDKRSSRSVPTGPGSRGGKLHDPAYRAGYCAGWRAASPSYRERENERSRQRRLKQDRERTDALVDDTPSGMDRLLTVREVAEILGIHTNTVKRLGDRGVLQFYRVSDRGDRRYSVEQVNRFLRNNRFNDERSPRQT